MNYKGDLVIKEIPYGKRKIKFSYDVVADRNNMYSEGDILPSRVVLRHIIRGIVVELVDENNEHLSLLGRL